MLSFIISSFTSKGSMFHKLVASPTALEKDGNCTQKTARLAVPSVSIDK